jgi:hypothetical protein
MNRLFEIAKELNDVAVSRMDYREKLQMVERDRKAYELQMVPEGGWPGKNADERKAAEMIAKGNDGQLYGYEIQRQTIEHNLAAEELRRDALTAEREAWMWTIRDRETMQMVFPRSVFEDYNIWQDEQYQASDPGKIEPGPENTDDRLKELEF